MSTGPAGPHGGNMDIRETAPGATVHLPVFVPGGQLFLGDAHAAMGHGELSATGLEMAAETTITIDLRKAQNLPGPRIEAPDEIMTIATGAPMEHAVAEGYAKLAVISAVGTRGYYRKLGFADGALYHVSYFNTPEQGRYRFTGGTGKFAGVEGGGTTEFITAGPDGRLTIRYEGTRRMR